MSQWITATLSLLDDLLWHPDTPLERWILVVVAVLVGLWVFRKTAGAMQVTQCGAGRSLVMWLCGLALMGAAMTAVRLYVNLPAPWGVAGAAVAAGLILVVPLMMWMQRATYLAGLLTWLVTTGSMAAVILLVSYVFDAARTGRHDAEKSIIHKQDVEQMLGK